MIELPDTFRLVAEGEDLYRFHWQIVYRDGREKWQYEQHVGALVQNLFAKLDNIEYIDEVRVYDFLGSMDTPCLVYKNPDGAVPDILYNGGLRVNEQRQLLAYTFGWKMIDGSDCWYIHFYPSLNPVRVWQDKCRRASLECPPGYQYARQD